MRYKRKTKKLKKDLHFVRVYIFFLMPSIFATNLWTREDSTYRHAFKKKPVWFMEFKIYIT